MKFKVTLENTVEYEVDAENEEEAVKSVVYGPMYNTAGSIKRTDEKSTYTWEEMKEVDE